MTILPFGKHSGKTFAQIATIDLGYLRWMANEHINRGGVDFSKLATEFLTTYEEEEYEVCPVCGETSCKGPSEHLPPRDPRIVQRLQSMTSHAQTRQARFDLSTYDGQQAYHDFVVDEFERYPDHASDWGGSLDSHRRCYYFNQAHYWYAEAIVRKVLNLSWPAPGSIPGDFVGRPAHVDLFI